jgi:hypothetical protein
MPHRSGDRPSQPASAGGRRLPVSPCFPLIVIPPTARRTGTKVGLAAADIRTWPAVVTTARRHWAVSATKGVARSTGRRGPVPGLSAEQRNELAELAGGQPFQVAHRFNGHFGVR